MSDITLSKGVRQNLLSLQSTAALLSRTQDRLSTGKKVNSALDNPINFFTSSGLQSRAGDLSRLLDSVSNAVQTLQAADRGISSIQKLIETAGATARQALTAAEGTTAYAVTQTGNIAIAADTAATGTSAAIAADAAATGTGSVTIAADVVSTTNGVAFNPANFQAEEQSQIVLDTSDFNVDMVDTEAMTIEIDGTTYTFVRDDSGLIADDVGTHTYYFDGGTPATAAQDLSDKITDILGAGGLDLVTSAYDGVANTITITAANNGAGEDLTFGGTSDLDDTTTLYQAASVLTIDDGTNPALNFTYVTGGGNGTTTFSTRDELLTAINAAHTGGTLDVSAVAVGTDNFRLVGDAGLASFDVAGTASAPGVLDIAGTFNTANYNTDLADLAGETLTISVGGTETDINITAATTRASLITALDGIAGLDAQVVGNAIELTATATNTYVEVTGTNTTATDLGFGVGNNLFTPNSDIEALFGESVTFSFGDTDVEVTFGTGAGEVYSRAGLLAALGANAALDGNQIDITASNNTDSISVTGTAAAALGFDANNDEFDPTNAQVAAFTGQFTIQVGSGAAQTIEFGNGNAGEITTRAALEERIAEINSNLTNVTLSITNNNFLNVNSTSSENITIGGSAPASFGVGAATYAPTATFTANATRSSLQEDFNKLLTQITELAGDASFNGINLLDGDDLTVTFNEDGSSTLQIDGVTFSAAGLGLTNVTGAGFQENTNVQAAIAQLDAATSTLRAQASKFGSNLSIVQTRQDFTKNMISVLQIGADNLVLADTNEEGANMLALNTRQQLSTTALSLAAQADQNVLRLF